MQAELDSRAQWFSLKSQRQAIETSLGNKIDQEAEGEFIMEDMLCVSSIHEIKKVGDIVIANLIVIQRKRLTLTEC